MHLQLIAGNFETTLTNCFTLLRSCLHPLHFEKVADDFDAISILSIDIFNNSVYQCHFSDPIRKVVSKTL